MTGLDGENGDQNDAAAMDNTRCHAMTEFLQTFTTISSPIDNFIDLADGVVIFEALSEIAPDYFDVTTIARHLGDNWVLKSSNLRKLLRNLEQYYHDELKKDAMFHEIDIQKMSRNNDISAIQDLVELVAAAAVTCNEKGQYVSRIMKMSSSSQVEMKGILESSLARLSDYVDDDDDDDDHHGEENELVFGQDEDDDPQDDDDYHHRGPGGPSMADGDDHHDNHHTPNRNLFGSNSHHFYKTHDADVDELEEQLMEARRELSAVKSQASIATEDHEKAQNKLKALVEDLQDRLVKRQDELIQLEEDLKTTTMQLEDTKSKLLESNEQNTQLADDLDVAKAKAQQLHKAEATVMAYKKKLDSVVGMNQQMTDLEDQAANYVRQIMELENEVKKSNALQKTVNHLQEQNAKLKKEHDNTTATNKTASTEIHELKQQLQQAQAAKKMFENELSELREQQEAAVNQSIVDDKTPGGATSALDGFAQQQSKEQHERTVVRLEMENKRLMERIAVLETSQDNNTNSSTPSTTATTATSISASPGSAEVEHLKAQLIKKEKDNAKISNEKDKLEAYTKRTLAKFQDKYLVALQECKAKLKEKQDKIEILETRSQTERTAQKREERLLSSTIYELGLGIMQNRIKGSAGVGGGTPRGSRGDNSGSGSGNTPGGS